MTFEFPHDVEGYLWEHEGRVLYELASRVPDDRLVVELGSYKGKATICMAQAHPVIAVDHFKGEQGLGEPLQHFDHITGDYRCAFEGNLKAHGVMERVVVLEADSAAAAEQCDGPVGLLFVDAGHDYASVRADLRAWEPRVEGYIVLDDTNVPGVRQAMNELKGWEVVDASPKMTVLRRQ